VLCCTEQTRKLILEECYKEFIKENPDFEGVQVTQDFLLKRVAEYYLSRRVL
jgi:hypothetical protein